MKKPQHVIIIGAMKAGTTTLYNHLSKHPKVCTCTKKEINYFIKKDEEKDFNVKDYRALFNEDPVQHSIFLEGSTGYAKYPKIKGVPKRIKDLGLEVKFIYLVRHPIDRINSEIRFWQNFPHWSDPKSNLGDMMDRSNYYLQLQQYEQYFDRSSTLVLDFDELKHNAQSVLDKVCNFLDINEITIPHPEKIANKSKTKTALQIKLQRSFPKLERYVPKFVKEALKKSFKVVSKPETKFLSQEEISEARSGLKNDILKFGEVYDFDVSKWGFSK